MKQYELSYLLPPDMPEDQIRSTRDRVVGYIGELGGNLNESKEPVQKTLGRPIRNHQSAFIIASYFFIAPEKIQDLEKKIRSEKDILNFILVARKVKKIAPAHRRASFEKEVEAKIEAETSEKGTPEPQKTQKPKKVEIKEIEKKLDEILGA